MVIEMVTPSEFDKILKARAAKLAARSEDVETVEEKTHVSVITVASESFGIPTQYLSCVVKSPQVSALPSLPKWFHGIAQIRGELVCAIDIASWFGVPGRARQGFLMVVENQGRKLGLLIDTVDGFRDVGKSDIAETFSGSSGEGHPILATTKDVTTILDIPKMFANSDMLVGGSTQGKPRGDQ